MALRAARRDASEWAIVHALEARGCKVHRVDAWGIPDLLVLNVAGAKHPIVLLEVKQPAGPGGGTSKKGQRLNEAQADFFAEAYLRGCPVYVVRTVEEAMEKVGL